MAPNTTHGSEPLNAAIAAHQSGRLDEALRHCKQALEESPKHCGALQLMGRLVFDAGDSKAALNWLQRSLEQSPNNPEPLCDQAMIHLHQGHAGDAVGCYERALKLAPQLLQARLQLASIVHRNGQIEEALKHYQKALKQAPELVELHCQIGVCEFQRGDLQSARGWFQACLRREPEHLDALENLGRTELKARQFQIAKQVLQRLLSSAPQRAETHHLLGFVHLHLGDINAAAESFLAPIRARFAVHGPGGEEPADALQVTETKLRHDLEQLNYLVERNLLAPQFNALPQYFAQALAALPAANPQKFFFSRPNIENFKQHYNRMLEDYRPQQIPGGALNCDLDLHAIETDFHKQGWVYFDDFLNPQALAALQEFCQRTSVWFEKKFQHEVGASLRNGFCCPLLLQIGEELRHTFPTIFGPHLFSGCFSYKYYQQNVDGHVHADRGAVSLNFWPTPDTANLDPDRGGLVIWNKRVPKEYFNASPAQIDHLQAGLIAAADALPATIPYRCNRAMLFHSDVLHRSDRMCFKDSYRNRRVSITYLYGQPGDAHSPDPVGC